MTNKKLYALLQGARYELDARDAKQIEQMLNTLPKVKRRTMREKITLMATAAAATLVILVLAAPPIVRAVEALVTRIFDDRIERIEEYTSLTENEKIQLEADQLAAQSRGHTLTGASVEFEGTTIELTDFDVTAPYTSGDETYSPELRVILTYASIPSFDPNYVDFTLELNGKTYQMEADDALDYRAEGKVITTYDGWHENKYSWPSNTVLEEDVLKTYLGFPIDFWAMDAKTELTLTGTLDGKSFSIPFQFDPERADAENLTRARESVEIQAKMNAEDKKKYEQYAEKAIPLDIGRSTRDTDFLIGELSVTGNNLFLTASFDPRSEAEDGGFMGYWIERIAIDGKVMSCHGANSDERDDGQYATIFEFTPNTDIGAMTGESLITIDVELGSIVRMARVAFRYDWDNGSVTEPTNENEESAWIAESDALTKAFEEASPIRRTFDLSQMNLSQTIDGVTITLKEAIVDRSTEQMRIELDTVFDRGAGLRPYMKDGTGTIDGKSSGIEGISWSADDIIDHVSYYLPVHYSEIGEETEIGFTIPIALFDDKDKLAGENEYSFRFTLEDAIVKD